MLSRARVRACVCACAVRCVRISNGTRRDPNRASLSGPGGEGVQKPSSGSTPKEGEGREGEREGERGERERERESALS